MADTVIQFGGGKFLRSFFDLFLQEAYEGRNRAVVVQSTDSDRARRFRASGYAYHVLVRGFSDGRTIDEVHEVRAVSRVLVAGETWQDVLDLARSIDLKLIVSNTTEAGLTLDERDRSPGSPPHSYPAKLLTLLESRYEAGLGAPEVLPCELVDGNGDVLRSLVLEQADRWKMDADLGDWLRDEVPFRNTLVDRIVSAPPEGHPLTATDPLLSAAEPFALWAVEGHVPDLFTHPAIEEVADVAPYSLRKVRILNGAHTALVAKAMPLGLETVREAMEDPAVGQWLRDLVNEEIVPVVDDRVDDAQGFASSVFDRFLNPFLNHRLADIALHHETKIKTRLLPTVEEYTARFGKRPTRMSSILP